MKALRPPSREPEARELRDMPMAKSPASAIAAGEPDVETGNRPVGLSATTLTR